MVCHHSAVHHGKVAENPGKWNTVGINYILTCTLTDSLLQAA